MMLQATELGLGSVWVCSFDPSLVKKEFNLPDSVEAVNILVIGYPAEGAEANSSKKRKPLSESVHYETY